MTARKTVSLLGGSAFLSWVTDPESGIAGAACDTDSERAAVRANGEFLEHVGQIKAATALPWDAQGTLVVPHALCDSVDESVTAWHWVAGRGTVTDTAYAVPAQAVALGWDPPAEHRWWVQTSVGTAAHPDPDAATRSALAEVLERDVLVRGWLTGEIVFHDLGEVAAQALPPALYERINTSDVTTTVLRAGTTAFDPVLALIHRRDGTNLTCGSALRADLHAAVRHSVMEALLVRVSLNATRAPGRLEAHHHDRGLLVARNGPAYLRFIEERLAGQDGAAGADTTLAALSAHAQDRFGHEPIVVELPDTEGHHVRRVVCPGSTVLEPRHIDPEHLSPVA